MLQVFGSTAVIVALMGDDGFSREHRLVKAIQQDRCHNLEHLKKDFAKDLFKNKIFAPNVLTQSR